MRPEEHIKDDLDRTVDGAPALTGPEQKFLTLYRELSESDRGHLIRIAEAMAQIKSPEAVIEY